MLFRSNLDEARRLWTQASQGKAEPTAAIFYNDQKPDKLFYQGLALLRLGKETEAHRLFHKLIDYGQAHVDDTVRMDYFAVSLPDLQIWDMDLNLQNRRHCKYVMALGLWGVGEKEAALKLLNEVSLLDVNHQGIKAFSSLILTC